MGVTPHSSGRGTEKETNDASERAIELENEMTVVHDYRPGGEMANASKAE